LLFRKRALFSLVRAHDVLSFCGCVWRRISAQRGWARIVVKIITVCWHSCGGYRDSPPPSHSPHTPDRDHLSRNSPSTASFLFWAKNSNTTKRLTCFLKFVALPRQAVSLRPVVPMLYNDFNHYFHIAVCWSWLMSRYTRNWLTFPHAMLHRSLCIIINNGLLFNMAREYG